MKSVIIRAMGIYLDILALISPDKAGRKGLLLFCRPFRIPLSQRQREFFNTADRFSFEHQGYRIQGYQWGRGPKKILFLHGWQSHSYRWKSYVESFSKEAYTIYAFDAPGHGLSGGNFLSMPLYSSLIEHFVKEKGTFHTVIGHSLGGFTLLYTLYRLPLLPVSKIILMAPPGEVSDFISFFQQTLKLSNRTVELIIEHFVRRFEVAPEYFSGVKFAEYLNLKGLIIHDEDDREAPYQYSTLLQSIWKKSRLITTKGHGHNLRSNDVVRQVVDFVHEPVPNDSLPSHIAH